MPSSAVFGQGFALRSHAAPTCSHDMRWVAWLMTMAVATMAATGNAAAPKQVTASEAEEIAPLKQAIHLVEQGQVSEAESLFKRWSKQHPDDAEAHFRFGLSILSQAAAVDGEKEAQGLRKKGRAYVQTAKDLGSDEALIASILAGIKADGSVEAQAVYSLQPDVHAAMEAAEKAFAQHDYRGAFDLYQRVLELDSTHYMATLYSGDALFARQDFEGACVWFEKAVALDPDEPTAHRYWADACTHLGKTDEALAHFIDAVVAQPYDGLQVQRMRSFAIGQHLPWMARLPRLPTAQIRDENGEPQLVVEPDSGPLGLLRALAMSKWRSEEFAKTFPDETVSRSSLPESAHALRTMLEASKELATSEPASIEAWKPGLETLRELDEAGLIEPFVLLNQADAGIAQDYAAYRRDHRADLVRYIRLYWCGLPE